MWVRPQFDLKLRIPIVANLSAALGTQKGNLEEIGYIFDHFEKVASPDSESFVVGDDGACPRAVRGCEFCFIPRHALQAHAAKRCSG